VPKGDINELVLKHEREISQLMAIQQILVQQTEKATETLEALKEALTEIKVSIEEQRKELRVAIEIRDKIEEFAQSLIEERAAQKQTNQKIFEKIEHLERKVDALEKDINRLSDSTAFARWLDGGFKTLSKRAAVFILLTLALIVLGAFLGIDLHHLLRK
jgi:septal ring factor EnvC (AmiA/AmiB activator)